MKRTLLSLAIIIVKQAKQDFRLRSRLRPLLLGLRDLINEVYPNA